MKTSLSHPHPLVTFCGKHLSKGLPTKPGLHRHVASGLLVVVEVVEVEVLLGLKLSWTFCRMSTILSPGVGSWKQVAWWPHFTTEQGSDMHATLKLMSYTA